MPRPQPRDLLSERGGLGPDLERDATVQARERRERQLAYAERARAYAANRPAPVLPAPEEPRARRLELIERQREYAARLPRPARPARPEAPRPAPVAAPGGGGPEAELERLREGLRRHDEQRARLLAALPDLGED